jgi:hypothetical protein
MAFVGEIPGRDAAFAALALLRCRRRIGTLIDALAEPRRNELARAVRELDGFNDARLKETLADVVRSEGKALRIAAARELGNGGAKASRALRKWSARGLWH